MPNIIRPEALRNAEAPNITGMIDAIENMCANYVSMKGKLPRYLYVNSSFWAENMTGLLPTVDMYGLKVSTHPWIPYEGAALEDEYFDPRRIGYWYKNQTRLGVNDAIESGTIELV